MLGFRVLLHAFPIDLNTTGIKTSMLLLLKNTMSILIFVYRLNKPGAICLLVALQVLEGDFFILSCSLPVCPQRLGATMSLYRLLRYEDLLQDRTDRTTLGLGW